MELPESQPQDLQLYHLKKAVDAMNDLIDGRHKKGHPKNVRGVVLSDTPGVP